MTSLPPKGSQHLSLSPETTGPVSTEKRHVTKLSTSSPEAIRVASEITPNRLANLLIRNGPLAIRLITAQLSIEVPGFELLSLSKQRRLIMAAMEQGDPKNNVVFEKIGWGQWAVRHVDSDYIVTEPNGSLDGGARLNIHELRETAKLGWLKKADLEAPSSLRDSHSAKVASRRDSISNHRSNMHNFRLPGERMETTSGVLSESEQDSDDEMDQSPSSEELPSISDLKMRFVTDVDDNAIDEDSEEDIENDALFKFDDDASSTKTRKSPPLQFANRVPTKFSPPPALAGSRRKSSSTVAPNSVVKNTSLHGVNRNQLFNRSRLNSTENLDEYILSSARNSSLSVLSPTVNNSIPTSSPLGSWSGKGEFLSKQENVLPMDHIPQNLKIADRRKLSFNESSMRSTLSSQKPYENTNKLMLSAMISGTRPRRTTVTQETTSDTDEEDWATVGAETLRSRSVGMGSRVGNKVQNDERSAAKALVDLMGM